LDIDNYGPIMYHTGTMDTISSSSTVKINLPLGIKRNIQNEAERIGISLQDFIRMLLASYFSKSEGMVNISRDRYLLDNAKKEIKFGKYKSIKSKKELHDYLSGL